MSKYIIKSKPDKNTYAVLTNKLRDDIYNLQKQKVQLKKYMQEKRLGDSGDNDLRNES